MIIYWRGSKHLQKWLPAFANSAAPFCSGRPVFAVLVPKGTPATPMTLRRLALLKKVLWLPEATRHRLSASMSRSEN